jgi:hypothetical protein
MLTAIRIAEEFNLDLTLEHATEGHKIAGLLAGKGIPVTVGPILFSRVKYELREIRLNPRVFCGKLGSSWPSRPMSLQRSNTW